MTDVENGNEDILNDNEKSDEKDTMPVISITTFEKNRVKIETIEDYYDIFVSLFKSEKAFLRKQEHLCTSVRRAGFGH